MLSYISLVSLAQGRTSASKSSGHYVQFPVVAIQQTFSFCGAIERTPPGPSVSIIKSVSLGAMPTKRNGTCAAAFLFLNGSAVLVFRARGSWLVFYAPVCRGGGCKLGEFRGRRRPKFNHVPYPCLSYVLT